MSYSGLTSRGFSETTRPEYDRSIRAHAVEAWRGVKLAEIEPGDVRRLFGKMRREGTTTSAIRKLRAALSALFATAVRDDKIRSNPVSGVNIPPGPTEQEPTEERAKALTRAEWSMLRSALPEDWHLFFDFLIQTGLRISEATGLTWQHVHLGERPRIQVREQFYRGERRKLKSKSSRRDLPLSPLMAERLLAHRRDHYKGPESPLFPSKTGTPLIAGKIRERVLWPAAISVGLSEEVTDGEGKTRIKPSVGFHSLRHSCASLLFDAGRNIKQVSAWLGHADPAFTLRTYVHLLDEGIGDASCFDDLLAPAAPVSKVPVASSIRAE